MEKETECHHPTTTGSRRCWNCQGCLNHSKVMVKTMNKDKVLKKPDFNADGTSKLMTL